MFHNQIQQTVFTPSKHIISIAHLNGVCIPIHFHFKDRFKGEVQKSGRWRCAFKQNTRVSNDACTCGIFDLIDTFKTVNLTVKKMMISYNKISLGNEPERVKTACGCVHVRDY